MSTVPDVITMPPPLRLKQLSNKDVLLRIGESYSVPLQETRNDKGDTVYQIIGMAGGPMAAKYLINLKRALTAGQIHALPDVVKHELAEANDIGVWEPLHLVNSSALSENVGVSRLVLPMQENTAGQYGNLSKAYCTPHIPELSGSQIKSVAPSIDLENCKLLSDSQVRLLRQMTPLLLVENDNGDTFSMDLTSMKAHDVDQAIVDLEQKGFRPVRLLFNHLPRALSLIFNVTGINDALRKIWEEQERLFFQDLLGSSRLEKVSAANLRSRFEVDMREAISSKISNHAFYAIVEPDGRLREVVAMQKKWAFFGLPSRENSTPSFNEGAFMSQRLQARRAVNRLNATWAGQPCRVPFRIVTMEEVLIENNWHNVRQMMEGVPKDRFSVLQFFSHHARDVVFKPQIENLLRTTVAFAVGLGDDDIQAELEKIEESSEHFKLVRAARAAGDVKFVDDRRIMFEQRHGSDVIVEAYERGERQKPRSTASQEFPWVYLRKENLAFEREKVMTLLFLEKRIAYLRQQGHVDFKVVLEKPVQKHDASDGSQGFIDLALFSKGPDGVRYGQCYEFKAWSTMTDINQQRLAFQANNYNVDAWMAAEKVEAAHDGQAVNRVLGMNLDLTNYEALAKSTWVSMRDSFTLVSPKNDAKAARARLRSGR